MPNVRPDRRRTVGGRGERLAEQHLARAGYRVLGRNFRTTSGELDLVVADRQAIVFCEVKTQISGTVAGPAGPLDAIGPRKRLKVRRMAREWLESDAAGERPSRDILRFDAIGVTISPAGELLSLEHIEDAF